MTVPQRLTAVTIGARSMPKLRAFYRAIGWSETDGADDTFTSFTLGAIRLALYPIELLSAEAAPNEPVVPPGTWNGMTLALNVASRNAVDEAIRRALASGASPVAPPRERSWGGYSGYFSDPEGQRWEIAWAPWLTEFE